MHIAQCKQKQIAMTKMVPQHLGLFTQTHTHTHISDHKITYLTDTKSCTHWKHGGTTNKNMHTYIHTETDALVTRTEQTRLPKLQANRICYYHICTCTQKSLSWVHSTPSQTDRRYCYVTCEISSLMRLQY